MTQAPTPPILILTEAELRAAVPLDLAAVDATEAAFAALARPGARMPPVLSMDLPEANGEVDVKTAFLPGFDAFAIKVSPGFFDNPRLGLPSLNGLMCVFSAKTGLVEAVRDAGQHSSGWALLVSDGGGEGTGRGAGGA